MFYTHTNSNGTLYYLNKKTMPNGAVLYFFSRDKRKTHADLPQGYEIVESERTKLPMVKKSK